MDEQDQGELAALLDAWATAIVANDPVAIDQFVEPEWVMVGEGGIFPREQFLAAVASGEVTHDTMSFDVHDVRIYGGVALVIVRGSNSGAHLGTPFALDEDDRCLRPPRRFVEVRTHAPGHCTGRPLSRIRRGGVGMTLDEFRAAASALPGG